jgi:superfamily II DNA or RNA helicase
LASRATPDRGDKRLLADYFENVAHETTLVDLIRGGYLSRVHVRRMPIRIDLGGVHVVAGDFAADELGHRLHPYLAAIADIMARDFAHRKTLCFLPLCSLSEEFASLCRERGIVAEHVEGASPDRSGVLERFRTGETTLVSNAQLWSEGYDEPSIDCILPLRPTKIRSLYAQQVGRGTRIHPGKEHLLVLDPLWLSERHDIVRPVSLVARDEEEAGQIHADGDLLENVEKARTKKLAEIERKLAARKSALAWELKANEARKAQEADLLELALAVNDADLASFVPTFGWHTEPVSQRQDDFSASPVRVSRLA